MIAFLLIFAVVLYFVERYSMEHGFDRVTVETSTDRVLVEPEEPFLWTVTVCNKKRIMVPYLKIKETIPSGLMFSETGEPVEKKGIMGYPTVLYLGGNQRMEFKRKVFLPARGRFFFRGVSAEAGDFLGLKTSPESFPELKEIVVKPKAYTGIQLEELLGGFLGEYSVRKSLLEDPVITIGFREYTGREPFRSISWTQSAKNNRLLVKQYDYTADFACTILLNTECRGKGENGKKLETCFSIVRAVCEELERKKIAYDFCTNGVIAGAMGNWVQVGEGLGTGHLETVLEGLGRMTFDHRESAVEFLGKTTRGIRSGRNFLLITPDLDDAVREQAVRLEAVSGRKVLVLNAEEFFTEPADAGETEPGGTQSRAEHRARDREPEVPGQKRKRQERRDHDDSADS